MRYFLVLAYFLAVAAHGETIEGTVLGSGTGINYRTLVKSAAGLEEKLCPRTLSDKIDGYKKMYVQIEGEREKRCFSPKSFKVLKTPRGAAPLAGFLRYENKAYLLETEKRKYTLGKISSRLKALKDQKVLLDLAQPVKKNSVEIYNVILFLKAP